MAKKINLDDIPDLNAEFEDSDDDLPSWGVSTTKKKPAAKPAPKPKVAVKPMSKREQLKQGKLVTPAREEEDEEEEESKPTPRYKSRVTGKTDVLDRLTDTASYTGAYKSRFDEDGKGIGSKAADTQVRDLSQITRPDKPKTQVTSSKSYREYKNERDEVDELATKTKKVEIRNDADFEIQELDGEDDMARMMAEAAAELAAESDDGLPDWNAAAKPKYKAKVAPKGQWKASTSNKGSSVTNYRAAYKAGKDVGGVRSKK